MDLFRVQWGWSNDWLIMLASFAYIMKPLHSFLTETKLLSINSIFKIFFLQCTLSRPCFSSILNSQCLHLFYCRRFWSVFKSPSPIVTSGICGRCCGGWVRPFLFSLDCCCYTVTLWPSQQLDWYTFIVFSGYGMNGLSHLRRSQTFSNSYACI